MAITRRYIFGLGGGITQMDYRFDDASMQPLTGWVTYPVTLINSLATTGPVYAADMDTAGDPGGWEFLEWSPVGQGGIAGSTPDQNPASMIAPPATVVSQPILTFTPLGLTVLNMAAGVSYPIYAQDPITGIVSEIGVINTANPYLQVEDNPLLQDASASTVPGTLATF